MESSEGKKPESGTKTQGIPGRDAELGDKVKGRLDLELAEKLEKRLKGRVERAQEEAAGSGTTDTRGVRMQRPATLTVVEGADKGKVYPLSTPAILIGRAPDNTIFLPDPTVSKRHARIEFKNAGYRVEDQGSRNGTLVNGKAVQAHTLEEGDRLGIGTTTLKFELK